MRPSRTQYFCEMVKVVASRGSCRRRKVGCILIDKHHFVLSTGYNGRPSGFDNCLDHPCEGADAKSGQDLDKCEAIHAEANALLQCPDTNRVYKAYCTTAPCIHCVKLLLNTSCEEIVFIDTYPHANVSKELWERAGRKWTKYDEDYSKHSDS